MTDLVGRVRALDADATPAPWEWEAPTSTSVYHVLRGFEDEQTTDSRVLHSRSAYVGIKDATLIAEFRSLAPALAARVEELEAENARLRAVLDEGNETAGDAWINALHAHWDRTRHAVLDKGNET